MTDHDPSYLLLRADAGRIPLADRSVDLVFGSPPYCDARTYGIAAQRDCLEWVTWMLDVTTEALRVARNCVVWIAAGVTRDRTYWPACEGLMWEWWRRGGSAYRPCYWHRVGIPGSGGDDWFRADVEYAMCFKRPGKLDWSDNTAMGHPPKYHQGGSATYRGQDGTRVSMAHGKRKRSGKLERQGYIKPDVANPGNLINTTLTVAGLADILDRYGKSTKTNPGEVLRELRQALDQEGFPFWFRGVFTTVLGQEILRLGLRGCDQAQDASCGPLLDLWRQTGSEEVPGRRELHRDGSEDVLRSRVPGQGSGITGRPETRGATASRPEDRQAEEATTNLFVVRGSSSAGGPSSGRGRNEQRDWQPGSPLLALPSSTAQGRELLSDLWETPDGLAALQQALPKVQEVWRSFNEAGQSAFGTGESPGLIHTKVGGGNLGHEAAHLNDAPFPEALAEFFIASLCRPGGIALDPFSGSGTTVSVAGRLGRRGIGIDIRRSQADIARRRIERPHQPVRKPDRDDGPLPLFAGVNGRAVDP